MTRATADEYRERVEKLLKIIPPDKVRSFMNGGLSALAGHKTSPCRGPNCGMSVYWIVTKNGKKMPVSPEGVAHWTDCPDRDSFR